MSLQPPPTAAQHRQLHQLYQAGWSATAAAVGAGDGKKGPSKTASKSKRNSTAGCCHGSVHAQLCDSPMKLLRAHSNSTLVAASPHMLSPQCPTLFPLGDVQPPPGFRSASRGSLHNLFSILVFPHSTRQAPHASPQPAPQPLMSARKQGGFPPPLFVSTLSHTPPTWCPTNAARLPLSLSCQPASKAASPLHSLCQHFPTLHPPGAPQTPPGCRSASRGSLPAFAISRRPPATQPAVPASGTSRPAWGGMQSAAAGPLRSALQAPTGRQVWQSVDGKSEEMRETVRHTTWIGMQSAAGSWRSASRAPVAQPSVAKCEREVGE